uniref:HTH CENPB-type domain-containing protein n=1 Tax=Ditylenchus dipsaci TaxID=166011 RepID=A0A915EB41_9BILA
MVESSAHQNESKHEERPLAELDAILEKKAVEFEIFKASDGWLRKFKHRHSISFQENQAEAADIDLEKLRNWQVRSA